MSRLDWQFSCPHPKTSLSWKTIFPLEIKHFSQNHNDLALSDMGESLEPCEQMVVYVVFEELSLLHKSGEWEIICDYSHFYISKMVCSEWKWLLEVKHLTKYLVLKWQKKFQKFRICWFVNQSHNCPQKYKNVIETSYNINISMNNEIRFTAVSRIK